MNKDHILYEYDKYVKKYKDIYGKNTIILIQLEKASSSECADED